MDDPVRSKVKRTMAHSALRRMAVLAQDIHRAERHDRAWVRTTSLWLGLLLTLLLTVAVVKPALLAEAMRWVAGVIR